MARLSPFQVQKIGRLFELYDRRGNGYLEREDWELLADSAALARGEERGSEAYERTARAFLTHFERYKAVADYSRDGRIGRDEWIDFFEIVLHDPVAFEAVVGSTIALLLSLSDLDDDAMLDRAELARLRRMLGVEQSEGDALFDRLDENGDGLLSCTEVRHAIETFLRSDDREAVANGLFGPLG